jgi:hypothetical protein
MIPKLGDHQGRALKNCLHTLIVNGVAVTPENHKEAMVMAKRAAEEKARKDEAKAQCLARNQAIIDTYLPR